jgi:signal transduction histidine kinase
MVVLLAAVAVTGILNIASTRRAFNEVKDLSAQLRALTWRMLRLQEDMQTSMARELHDEFGQILTAMNMLVGRAKRHLEAGATETNGPLQRLIKDVDEVQTIAQQTLERIRTTSRLLHPVILDDFGLEQAIAWYVDQFSRQHGIKTELVRNGTVGYLSPDASIHLYRIVQEALSNVSRHSGATEAWVRLTQSEGTLTLEIEDAGRGLPGGAPPAPDSRGIGVISMRERAELMGGDFSLSRGARGGLLVSVHVPQAKVATTPASEVACSNVRQSPAPHA